MPVPAFNGKSVDLSPVVHNGGLLYKYIDCLGRMPVCFGLYGKGLIMGKLMIPDYRDDIEETILPDSDSEKEAQEADVKPAVADTSENRNEENNEEKDKGKNGISAVADRIFDFLVMAGQYFCHIIADVFSKPAVYVAYAAVFIWKHTALFRDAVKRTFCEIGSFFFAPLLKSKRVLQRTNRQIRSRATKEGGKAVRKYSKGRSIRQAGPCGNAVQLCRTDHRNSISYERCRICDGYRLCDKADG